MSDEAKAVFLSYASQDAEAAKRICDALRAAGLEVWFDQSELRGGDAWDQKIRRQIKECALFVPIISANTQTRPEGYFRREWKQAVERTHDMADDVPFLFPIVVGDVTESTARVPDKFREVQWTRLLDGGGNAAFGERVKKLLGSNEVARVSRPVNFKPTGRETRATRRSWLLPAIIGPAVVAVIVVVVWQPWRTTEKSALAVPTAPVTQPAEPLSPARQLAERARAITLPGSLTRAQLDTAEELCTRALTLDPTDGAVWTEAARVDLLKVYPYGYDRSEERRKQAMSRAARAITLAPDSFDARVVQAAVFAHAGGSTALLKEAEKTFRELIASHRDDRELKVELAEVLREQQRFDEAAKQFEALGEYEVAGWSYYQGGDARAGLAAVNRGLSAKRSVTALQLKAILQTDTTEDLDAVQATLDQLRPSELLSEMPASIAMKVALYRRDPERLLQIAQGLTQDYLDSNAFRGPRQYFTGLAHEIAGRPAAAAGEWRAGIAVVQTRLQSAPDDRELILWLAWLHAALNDTSEAELLLARAQALAGLPVDQPDPSNVKVFWRLGRNDSALAGLGAKLRSRPTNWEEIHAEMRYSPIYDGVRGDPRFEKLLRDNLPEGAKPLDPPANR